MEIKGITPDQFAEVVGRVSRERYDGNVITERGARLLNSNGTRFRQRVIVISSRGAGARRSWSGRRMPAACWHVFRDVVRATLAEYPAATFRTSYARYTADNFEVTYPATGTVNVGSAFQPAYLPELCECVSTDPRDRVRYTPPPAYSPSTDDPLMRRIHAVESVVAGECGWCSAPTMGTSSVWCSQDCQECWQNKYALSPAQ